MPIICPLPVNIVNASLMRHSLALGADINALYPLTVVRKMSDEKWVEHDEQGKIRSGVC